MASTPYIPKDPLARFQEIYEALNQQRSWWRESASLRFAAIAAMNCPGTAAQAIANMKNTAKNLGEKATWTGRLDSRLRFIVASMLIVNGDTAAAFLKEVKRVRAMFREAGLRRAAIFETFAVLILRIQSNRVAVTKSTVDRFKAIYEQMKRHHWWLTGPDDFPACAILTSQKDSPANIGQDIENIFQALRAKGFTAGDPLQTATNILYLAKLDSRDAAHRFSQLADGFRSQKVKIWQCDYEELAILTFLDHPTKRIVDSVLKNREAMKRLNPKPERVITFNLAASITFLQLVQVDQNMKTLTSAKAMLDMQAIIAAQQAAVAGAVAGVTASAAVATN